MLPRNPLKHHSFPERILKGIPRLRSRIKPAAVPVTKRIMETEKLLIPGVSCLTISVLSENRTAEARTYNVPFSDCLSKGVPACKIQMEDPAKIFLYASL